MGRIKSYFIVLIICCSLGAYTHAQIGITLGFRSGEFTQWNTDQAKISGVSGGLEYAVPLLDNRIAFAPRLSYIQMSSYRELENGIPGIDFKGIQVALPARFYFINFLKDCDCPTFKRKNGEVNSKLFFEMAPLFTYRTLKSNHSESEWDLKLGVGLGLGYHLDLFDPLRLTPIAGLDYIFSKGRFESSNPDILPRKSEAVFLRLGIHLSIISTDY